MQFDGRGIRFDVTYQLLQNFARRLNMPFDTGANQINIIELRGAKPVHGGNTVSTQNQVESLIWDYDALHDLQVNLPVLASQLAGIVMGIKNNNPEILGRIMLRMRRDNFLEIIQSLCEAIRDLDSTQNRQYADPARQIEQDIDRLGLVDKQRRVTNNNVRDSTCQLELADNVVDRMNDAIILVWQDSNNNPHIRALLVSIDPGSVAISRGRAASIGSGSYYATWGGHGPNYPAYPCLNINEGVGIRGTRISGHHRDQGDTPGDDMNARADDTITITEYTFYSADDADAPDEIQIHAGPSPAGIIYDWSDGCTIMAGSQVAANPADTYDQIFGSDAIARGESWLGIDPPEPLTNQPRFNVIVWDAWSLYRLFLGRDFKPNLQIGAADITRNLYPGENAEQWVDRMQHALNEKMRILALHRDTIENQFDDFRDLLYDEQRRNRLSDDEQQRVDALRLFIPPNMNFPQMNVVPIGREDNAEGNSESMVFGNLTAAALRTFQLACFLLLEDGQLRVGEVINRKELMWERSQWICGTQTWKLLEAVEFIIRGPSDIDATEFFPDPEMMQ